MTQKDINQLAAKSLLERAILADTQSRAEMLIDTAYTLDNTIDTQALKTLWLEM